MAKALLNIGYYHYVVDLKDAVMVAEVLAKAELYELKYVKSGENTHHIYDNDKAETGSLRLIADSLYQMAKLAGKPEKDS